MGEAYSLAVKPFSWKSANKESPLPRQLGSLPSGLGVAESLRPTNVGTFGPPGQVSVATEAATCRMSATDIGLSVLLNFSCIARSLVLIPWSPLFSRRSKASRAMLRLF